MQCLDMVMLADASAMMPQTLSGGMAQCVAIARALAAEGDIFLLDEPFSALDEKLRNTISKRLIDYFHYSDATVVMVSHSTDDAVALGSRIIHFGN